MKRNLERWLTIGVAALAIVATVLFAVLALEIVRPAPVVHEPVQLETPMPTVEPSDLMAMGGAHIPTSADCLLCHETSAGVGIRPVPVLGHPLEGWTSCTSCHSEDRLVKTAPGHTRIAETECLNCHKAGGAAPAITRPHSLLRNTGCLGCHGGKVHLPSTMIGRTDTECWLCHQAAAEAPPQFPHPLNTEVSCRTCHTAGKVGALPTDHAARDNTTCLLCHDISPTAMAAPSAPHSLSDRTDLCVFCHRSSKDGTTR